jgi:hypothetical protein
MKREATDMVLSKPAHALVLQQQPCSSFFSEDIRTFKRWPI